MVNLVYSTLNLEWSTVNLEWIKVNLEWSRVILEWGNTRGRSSRKPQVSIKSQSWEICDRKIVDISKNGEDLTRWTDRATYTIRCLQIKSISLKLYQRRTLFSFIKSLFPNRFIYAISGITESAHKSNPHTVWSLYCSEYNIIVFLVLLAQNFFIFSY